MRYLLVDRILEWKTGEQMAGVKNVAMTEDFLEFHFPRNPIMPGVLLLEALVQLAGWLEAASSDFQRWFLPRSVRKCMFYGFAHPGDTVELEVRAQAAQGPSRRSFEGVCSVLRAKRVVAEFEGETVPLADIEDPADQRRAFQLLTRTRMIP
jgi:3-hydroxyacyl-[acyl-carrier-protein] dehydratase